MALPSFVHSHRELIPIPVVEFEISKTVSIDDENHAFTSMTSVVTSPPHLEVFVVVNEQRRQRSCKICFYLHYRIVN